jgi:ribosomal protein L2
MVEKCNPSDHKHGGAASEDKQSSKEGPTCWRCGKKGHVQMNCRGNNYSGAIAPNRGNQCGCLIRRMLKPG